MSIKTFSLIYGVAFLVIGVAGFIPGLVTMPEMETGHGAHGRLFGLFPVNTLHNLVHIIFGIWGLAAYRTLSLVRPYAITVAVAYALLAVMGVFPALSTAFGLVPLYGNDVWLHSLLALGAAYFAFMHRDVSYLRAGA